MDSCYFVNHAISYLIPQLCSKTLSFLWLSWALAMTEYYGVIVGYFYFTEILECTEGLILPLISLQKVTHKTPTIIEALYVEMNNFYL